MVFGKPTKCIDICTQSRAERLAFKLSRSMLVVINPRLQLLNNDKGHSLNPRKDVNSIAAGIVENEHTVSWI